MKLIISHVRLFMIISHVKIIAFQKIIIHCLWIFYIARKDCSLHNKQNNTCVQAIPDLFLVLNMISHSFAALTREISRSTLEINLVFPRTHVFILYLNFTVLTSMNDFTNLHISFYKVENIQKLCATVQSLQVLVCNINVES